jgi:hypothetical protein
MKFKWATLGEHAVLVLVLLGSGNSDTSPSECTGDEAHDDMQSLLQLVPTGTGAPKPKQRQSSAQAGQQDLAFMHVPYNFGHTVELVSSCPPTFVNRLNHSEGGNGGGTEKSEDFRMPGGKSSSTNASSSNNADSCADWADGVRWGKINPDLDFINNLTGCQTYFTPAKYWPEELAAKYFGENRRFGILRDPYERLVAFFRGNYNGYGGGPYPKDLVETCDVNQAVKQTLQDYIKGGDPFAGGCSLLPQAEYFDGKYGIDLPVDNRHFPSAVNKLFEDHGYEYLIPTEAVMHVRGCDNSWMADFDNETRQLIKQVYARDLDLLCQHFGYCKDENVCLQEVPHMCPETEFTWNAQTKHYEPK